MGETLVAETENQAVLDQIILGIAHELNNPNAFVRLCAMNLKKMCALMAPCLDEYEQNHPDEKLGPYTPNELKARIVHQCESVCRHRFVLLLLPINSNSARAIHCRNTPSSHCPHSSMTSYRCTAF